MKKPNGSGTHDDDGQDGADGHHDPKITRFPTPAERREIERMKAEMEKARDAARRMQQGGGYNPAPASEPVLNLPPVVKALCGALLLAHVIAHYALSVEWQDKVIEWFAFIPARWSGGMPFMPGGLLGPLTHIFLHGGWLHLGINIGTLMAFGSAIEKFIGGKKFLLLFAATAVVGVAFHFVVVPMDVSPLIGASGGVSGLFGAVMVMAQDRGMTERTGFRALLPVVLIWVGINLFFGLYGMPGETSAIAWTVHIGGFLGGLFLYRPIARLKI